MDNFLIKRFKVILSAVILLILMSIILVLRFPRLSNEVNNDLPLISSPIYGSTYYLDANHPESRDIATNGSIDKPWKTLYYALRQLGPGDTLLIRAGIYQEHRWLTLEEEHSGREGFPILVQAYLGEVVIIKNSKPISFYGANWWTIDGLIFESPYEDRNFIQLGLQEELGNERTVAAKHITIRNCEFRNGVKSVISFQYAQDILIENNYFHHVRPGKPFFENKTEVNALDVRYIAENIIVRGNRFEDIGSDGVHLGAQGYLAGAKIGKVDIIDNEFWITRPYNGIFGNVGENGIDVKWVVGPVLISGNTIYGFRPTTPEQDASGANGEGIVIHDNAQNVVIENNYLYDNTSHIVISRGAEGTSGFTTNIVLRNNQLREAKNDTNDDGAAIIIIDVGTITILGNEIISSDDTFYIITYIGGKVIFKNNVIIGGMPGGNIDKINWIVEGNTWQDAAVHPLLEDKK